MRAARTIQKAPNQIGAIMKRAGLRDIDLCEACRPELCASYFSRVKHSLIAPTVPLAWRIVGGLRVATGLPLAFEDVFPGPTGRPRVVPVQQPFDFKSALADFDARNPRGNHAADAAGLVESRSAEVRAGRGFSGEAMR